MIALRTRDANRHARASAVASAASSSPARLAASNASRVPVHRNAGVSPAWRNWSNWATHPTYCNDVVIKNVTIRGRRDGHDR